MAEQQKASQEFVAISKIEHGVAYLKKGGVFRIVMVNGVNFDLKSEEEQGLILSGFQNFLNTLEFSTQFFIHSRKLNIGRYLAFMKEREEQETNELLKIQIREYIDFIREFVEQNQIISKTFFVVVPQHKISGANPAKSLLNIFEGKKEKTDEKITDEEMLQQLSQRVESVISGLEGIGLRAIPLEDEELIELFYNLYNPQLVEKSDSNVAKLNKD